MSDKYKELRAASLDSGWWFSASVADLLAERDALDAKVKVADGWEIFDILESEVTIAPGTNLNSVIEAFQMHWMVQGRADDDDLEGTRWVKYRIRVDISDPASEPGKQRGRGQ